MGANRPPSKGVECRLGSSIIKTASPRPRTWQSGGGGGRAAPRVGRIGVPAPPPNRGRWYAGAIDASSPHGPSRSTDPTRTSVRPRTWQSGGGGGRAAPRVGQIGVPAAAPPPDRGRWYAGAIGASSPHGPSRSTDPTQTSVRPRTWQWGAVGAVRHLGWDESECPPLPPTGADGTPAQLTRAHRTVLPAALIRP